jgi:hypothetical protein
MAVRKSIRPARQSDRAGTNRLRNPALNGAQGGGVSGPSVGIVRILNNPVYKGEVVWGRSRWIRSPRDSAIRRCEVVEDPEQLVNQRIDRLRIVSDEQWGPSTSSRAPERREVRRSEPRSGALVAVQRCG